MEKILNKIFIQYSQSHFNDKENNLIENFQSNLEKLENLIEKRIKHNYDSEEAVYYNILHHIETHINATKIKFIDLYKGYIFCINSNSYSGALVISRTLLENISMLDFLSMRLIKLVESRDYIKIIKELLNLSVPSWQTFKVDDYRRTHVNDALRHFSKSTAFKEKSEKEIFKIYDPISEMSHPSPSSFLMYQTTSNNIENDKIKFQTSFSQNSENIHEKVFPPISWVLVYPDILINKLYPKIQKELIDEIKKKELEIHLHFKNNTHDSEKYNDLVRNLVLK